MTQQRDDAVEAIAQALAALLVADVLKHPDVETREGAAPTVTHEQGQ